MRVGFDNEGITRIVKSLADSADKDSIELVINGVGFSVPMCADNANEIEYMLKDMLISEMTGEATRGNTKVLADTMDARYAECLKASGSEWVNELRL